MTNCKAEQDSTLSLVKGTEICWIHLSSKMLSGTTRNTLKYKAKT